MPPQYLQHQVEGQDQKRGHFAAYRNVVPCLVILK